MYYTSLLMNSLVSIVLGFILTVCARVCVRVRRCSSLTSSEAAYWAGSDQLRAAARFRQDMPAWAPSQSLLAHMMYEGTDTCQNCKPCRSGSIVSRGRG
jgi:hypothetical protein